MEASVYHVHLLVGMPRLPLLRVVLGYFFGEERVKRSGLTHEGFRRDWIAMAVKNLTAEVWRMDSC